MIDLRKAAEQAIFMLTLIKHATSPKPDDGQGNEDVYDAADAAITALREALATPQPKGTPTHSCSYYCERPDCIKAQRDELREALAKPVVPEGFVLVPTAALRWLLGEQGLFSCPPEDYFRGKPAPFWWRKVFRKMLAAAPLPKDTP